MGSRAKFVLRTIAAVTIAILITLLFASVLFLWGPITWRYLKGIGKIDWAQIVLGVWLFGYFIQSAQLWFARIAHGERFKGRPSFQLFMMLTVPAWTPIAYLHMLLQGMMMAVFFQFLHQQSKAIALRSFNVLLLIWISVYCILLFANLWQQDACQWVFPRILTCVLAKYDGLAGGLIGAGGTIFAAWIAWIAFQEQNKGDAGQRDGLT